MEELLLLKAQLFYLILFPITFHFKLHAYAQILFGINQEPKTHLDLGGEDFSKNV